MPCLNLCKESFYQTFLSCPTCVCHLFAARTLQDTSPKCQELCQVPGENDEQSRPLFCPRRIDFPEGDGQVHAWL